ITPSFYKNFKCIAGACPDSCCQGWEVDADDESLAYYKTLSGSLRERIDSVLDKDEFGNTIFRLADKKRCPFLNNENLCDMHIAIGGEHTPYTCRTFPRFINDFGGTREMGISFSCPVASDMMWNLNKDFSFDTDINSLPPSLNDIDAELYFKLLTYRKKAYSIIQNREVEIKERLKALLDFAVDIQRELDNYCENGSETQFFDIFNNPEVINDEWVKKVKNHNTVPVFPDDKICENIAMYFLFRYFLTAVYDFDVLSKVKMAVIGVLIPAYFGNDAWTIHLWSKETEHSDVNMERYKYELRHNVYLSVAELKKHLI
ncbi:MAG: flagellin lysine-N-methylase, partial [Eubacterium sp.]|nr:flagellin lysine-N-methylase [Eubacterium sp.]